MSKAVALLAAASLVLISNHGARADQEGDFEGDFDAENSDENCTWWNGVKICPEHNALPPPKLSTPTPAPQPTPAHEAPAAWSFVKSNHGPKVPPNRGQWGLSGIGMWETEAQLRQSVKARPTRSRFAKLHHITRSHTTALEDDTSLNTVGVVSPTIRGKRRTAMDLLDEDEDEQEARSALLGSKVAKTAKKSAKKAPRAAKNPSNVTRKSAKPRHNDNTSKSLSFHPSERLHSFEEKVELDSKPAAPEDGDNVQAHFDSDDISLFDEDQEEEQMINIPALLRKLIFG